MKEIVIAQPLGITRELLESLASGLKKEGWNLTAYDKVPSGQEELGKRIEGADIAVIANYPLKKEALEKASSLKYLCVAFTGVDHVDISYCKERHIAVSNCAGYSTESVAELAFGMALSLYRMLPECGKAIRNGKRTPAFAASSSRKEIRHHRNRRYRTARGRSCPGIRMRGLWIQPHTEDLPCQLHRS